MSNSFLQVGALVEHISTGLTGKIDVVCQDRPGTYEEDFFSVRFDNGSWQDYNTSEIEQFVFIED